MKLKVNTSHGPDGVSANILKELAYSISNPLSLLLKLSFSTATLPDVWKTAIVSPILKKVCRQMLRTTGLYP